MILNKAAHIFDCIHAWWERPQVAKRLSLLLIAVFVVCGLLILLGRLGLVPPELGLKPPQNPFFAIQVAFTFILLVEVVELVFSIPESVSLAVSKQMEIMALLLLRESFADIGLLSTEISIATDGFMLAQVGITAVAGLLLFICRGVFMRFYTVRLCEDMQSYINAKKFVCLFLFAAFVGAAAYDCYQVFFLGAHHAFFKIFYTFLIFTDILLILVGQYFHTSFHSTFRNSGFAVSTLLMRLALGSPHYIAAVLCIFSGLYLIALAWADARLSKTYGKTG